MGKELAQAGQHPSCQRAPPRAAVSSVAPRSELLFAAFHPTYPSWFPSFPRITPAPAPHGRTYFLNMQNLLAGEGSRFPDCEIDGDSGNATVGERVRG